MRDFVGETRKVIKIYLGDPTPIVEVAVRDHILHLVKSSPGDVFALHRELVSEWGNTPLKWPDEDFRRAEVISMIARMIENERLCHMCQLSHFVLVNILGEGTNMEVRHYHCGNPACGAYNSVIVHPA